MSGMAQGSWPVIEALQARKGYDRIATAHLLEAGFHEDVEAAAERVGMLCSIAYARLSIEALALEVRLRVMVDTPLTPWKQILRHEAETATARLQGVGTAASEEIHTLTVALSLKTQESAGLAADALRGGRGHLPRRIPFGRQCGSGCRPSCVRRSAADIDGGHSQYSNVTRERLP